MSWASLLFHWLSILYVAQWPSNAAHSNNIRNVIIMLCEQKATPHRNVREREWEQFLNFIFATHIHIVCIDRSLANSKMIFIPKYFSYMRKMCIIIIVVWVLSKCAIFQVRQVNCEKVKITQWMFIFFAYIITLRRIATNVDCVHVGYMKCNDAIIRTIPLMCCVLVSWNSFSCFFFFFLLFFAVRPWLAMAAEPRWLYFRAQNYTEY